MFISYKNWLFERKAANLSYGCLMLYANVPNWKSIISIVDKEDIYETEDDYGYEKEPHITIIYGLHDEELHKEDFYTKIETIIKPLTISIDNISYFETNEPKYDVVKFDVPKVKQLLDYRKEFIKYPNTQTYPGYTPHMTIAYVKKGEAKKYKQKIKPFKVTFNQAVYSSPDFRKKYFNL